MRFPIISWVRKWVSCVFQYYFWSIWDCLTRLKNATWRITNKVWRLFENQDHVYWKAYVNRQQCWRRRKRKQWRSQRSWQLLLCKQRIQPKLRKRFWSGHKAGIRGFCRRRYNTAIFSRHVFVKEWRWEQNYCQSLVRIFFIFNATS